MGRRGGSCQLLGVSVRSQWTACQMALPSFAPRWDSESHESLASLGFQAISASVSVSASQGLSPVGQPPGPNLTRVWEMAAEAY